MDRMTLMFNRLIRPLKRRVFLMVSRAVIKIINDAEGIQKLQLVGYDGELHEGVERFQEYGFTSHPKSGAEAVVVAVAGNRGHSLVIALDDRKFRLKSLQPGEMAIYDDLGQKVHLKRDGIYVETPLKLEAIVGSSARLIAPAGVRLETPNLEVTATPMARRWLKCAMSITVMYIQKTTKAVPPMDRARRCNGYHDRL